MGAKKKAFAKYFYLIHCCLNFSKKKEEKLDENCKLRKIVEKLQLASNKAEK